MSIYDKIASIKEHAKGYHAARAASQLVYALKISETEGGIFGDTVRDAVDFLTEGIARSGCITKEDAAECERRLLPMSEKAKQYTVHCVSHAHIDMNWMWSYQETVAITLDTFRTVLRLMEEYPQLTFSQSQASTYRIVEEYDPAMFAEIRRRVAEGRWEVSASTWVEADKNMPSGESLARQLLYTKQYFSDRFGLGSDALQLDFEPDTFGHSMSVPEILYKGGVRYYYHCRGSEGPYIYQWKAPSGESVLAYREPAWYNAEITPDFMEYVPEFCRKHGIDMMLKVYGVGDHGGGPTRRDIETLIDMAGWPVAPEIRFSSYHRFFRGLERVRGTFPVVGGELNYVFTGCYSSQSRIKRANRTAEDDLYAAEALSSLAMRYAGGADHTAMYAKAWEKVLFNQFHDIITGSGVRDTREHALGRIQEALGYTVSGVTEAMTALAAGIDTSGIDAPQDRMSSSEGGGVGFRGCGGWVSGPCGDAKIQAAERGNGPTRILHVFNPTGFDREEPLEVTVWDYPGKADLLTAADHGGASVPCRHLEHNEFWSHRYDKFLIDVKIPSFGYGTYVLSRKERAEYAVALPYQPRVETYPKNVLENGCIRAEFDDNNMILLSLFDKKAGRELIRGRSGYFRLVRQSHRSVTVMSGNAWVEGYELGSEILNETRNVFVTAHRDDDPLRRSIGYSIPFGKSTLRVVVSLDKDSPVLRYSADCDWHESFSAESGIPALKFVVPVNYAAQGYKYEVPFGVAAREDMNHDVPARGFAFAVHPEGGAGVVLMTDSCYAYRGEKDSLSVTLLRASQEPDPHPEYGLHHYRIGIGACDGDPAQLFRHAALFTLPLRYIAGSPHPGTLALREGFIRTEGDIMVSAVKAPERPQAGVLILRIFETGGRGTIGKILFDREIAGAAVVGITEEPSEDAAAEVRENTVIVSLKPHEVATLRVETRG